MLYGLDNTITETCLTLNRGDCTSTIRGRSFKLPFNASKANLPDKEPILYIELFSIAPTSMRESQKTTDLKSG